MLPDNNPTNVLGYKTLLLILTTACVSLILISYGATAAAETATSVTPRTIRFSNHTWTVKSGCELGPGPNCWSDSAQSVWLDNEGRLHLKLREIDGVWHSAEVATTTCTLYGEHRFYTVGRMDLYDKNVVLGLFLYKDDLHELDIEFSRWGQDAPPHNAQYVVQPYLEDGNLHPFFMRLNGDNSTHGIDWRETSVHYISIHGHHEDPPSDDHVIDQWYYTGDDVPTESDCLKIHINLWQFRDTPPSDGREVEIIISHVVSPHRVHIPLVARDAAPPPWITLTATGATVSGEVGPPEYCNDDFKVTLYARGDIWYVQPTEDNPNISIDEDCTWSSTTNPWSKLAAHLVTAEFSAAPQIPTTACPPIDIDGEEVIASSCFPE